MIASMTGYGRAQAQCAGREITVELRSVNARYFEYTARVPRALAAGEDAIKKEVAARVARGKVELSVQLRDTAGSGRVVQADVPLAQGYLAAARQLAQQLEVRDDVAVSHLLRFPDVLTTAPPAEDEQQLLQDVLGVVRQALEGFAAMRCAEGEKMKADILSRLDLLENAVGEVEADSAARVERYTSRLYERLRELLADRQIDDARLVTEAALFADKTAVDEETVRLRSHIRQYRDILAAGGPVGRKLDFLTQELNRETNTIGSKCQDLQITRLVVEMKSEIEKIREQIQNIE